MLTWQHSEQFCCNRWYFLKCKYQNVTKIILFCFNDYFWFAWNQFIGKDSEVTSKVTKAIVDGITMEQKNLNSFWFSSLRKNDIWDLVYATFLLTSAWKQCVYSAFWWKTTSRHKNYSSNLQQMNAVDYVHHHNGNLAGSICVEMLAAKQILFWNMFNICFRFRLRSKQQHVTLMRSHLLSGIYSGSRFQRRLLWLTCFRLLKIHRSGCSL